MEKAVVRPCNAAHYSALLTDFRTITVNSRVRGAVQQGRSMEVLFTSMPVINIMSSPCI